MEALNSKKQDGAITIMGSKVRRATRRLALPGPPIRTQASDSSNMVILGTN